MLASSAIRTEKVLLGRAERSPAVVRVQTRDGDTIYTEHERLHGWRDAADVGRGFDDPSLQCNAVGDFEQRIYVLQVYLPESEDLNWIGVERREVGEGSRRAEEKVVIVLVAAMQLVLDSEAADIVNGGIAVAINVAILVESDNRRRIATSPSSYDVLYVPLGSSHARSPWVLVSRAGYRQSRRHKMCRENGRYTWARRRPRS